MIRSFLLIQSSEHKYNTRTCSALLWEESSFFVVTVDGMWKGWNVVVYISHGAVNQHSTRPSRFYSGLERGWLDQENTGQRKTWRALAKYQWIFTSTKANLATLAWETLILNIPLERLYWAAQSTHLLWSIWHIYTFFTDKSHKQRRKVCLTENFLRRKKI